MNMPMHRFSVLIALRLFVAAAAGLMAVVTAAGQALTTLEYRIVGQRLTVSPAVVAVPKGIPGSVLTAVAGDLPQGAFVEATLRGPSFPARRLVAQPNAPLLLPPLNLVGDYSLDGIRIVDPASGATLLEGNPASIPVRVFDEVLISRVTSRPLTIDEIQERGIQIDESNFRAIEFEVGFVIDGQTVPVRFPVVAPSFRQSTEIIPLAELEEQLAAVERINDEIARSVQLPPELEVGNLNIQIKGINFQEVDEGENDLALQIPPIPALMVIPGNIGFLNQFFSVMIFTENGAPTGSGLSVRQIEAELILPPGPDRVAGTYESPGDDPLRFARVGTDGVINRVQPIVRPGPDGILGTPDDIARLNPGQTGQAEFLVEGLQEGLHVMDLQLRATLDGLAAGPVQISGKAAGSVLVRNPRFSMAFTHPRTVRLGEPYEATITILNTGAAAANLVSVNLNRNNISGGVLETDETVQLGTIEPGETATATFRIRSLRTGAITFSNLTTSDDSLVGRFRLRTGVDERGVTLSPDTLLLPDFVDELPDELVAAANRVLGQALSAATAGSVPAGVQRVSRPYIRQKAIELAEAGQRLRYGEGAASVLPDLLLDWQGARDFSAGWDQILRTTNAGREWREALARALENVDTSVDATARMAAAAENLAGRGEAWWIATIDAGNFQATSGPQAPRSEFFMRDGEQQRVDSDRSAIGQSLGYGGRVGAWLVAKTPGEFFWQLAEAPTQPLRIGLWIIGVDGQAEELRWDVSGLVAGDCLSYDAVADDGSLRVRSGCDGNLISSLPAIRELRSERPPTVLAVRQDPEVLVGRPDKPCSGIETTNDAGEFVPIRNYANVVSVLFSKPMNQAGVNVPDAYGFDSGNRAAFVQVQPGGRVALLTLREPVGGLVPRTLSVSPAVTDMRGNPLQSSAIALQSRLVEGISVQGRVVKADGSLAAGVPVTLTYYDEVDSLFGCNPWVRRTAQVRTSDQGAFAFDFILAGLAYSVSTTDTSGLSEGAVQLILDATRGDEINRQLLEQFAASPSVANTLLAEFVSGALPEAIAKAEGLDRALVRDYVVGGSTRIGTEAVFALRFRGRGAVVGQVLEADGLTPVAGAAVNLFPDPDSRELGRGLLSDADGQFAFFGVPLGSFSIEATSPSGRRRMLIDTIDLPGDVRRMEVILSSSIVQLTAMQGRVTEPDGSPHAGAQVYIGRYFFGRYGGVVGSTTADSEGYWSVSNVPVGTYDPLAISADGRRKGDRLEIAGMAGTTATVNITLQARASVTGRVETSTGLPVANALVGGGEALVRSDDLGRFTLTGVPTGQRRIEAGVERDPAAGIDFPRLGSTSLNVLSGVDNFVVVRLIPSGRIIGRVLDKTGQPVPNARVAIPRDGGFLWVEADSTGNYEFVGLALDTYDLSSPAPATEDPFDPSAVMEALRGGSQEEILAAIGETFAAFTGVNNPLLNGDGSRFNPRSWGYVEGVRLQFDGQTEIADIRHLAEGTVSGTILNGQGVPIGARVRLTGIGPSLSGRPMMIIRGERDSDPAIGAFEFPGQAFVGDWGLQAASPFFPVVISTSGRTTSLEPDATGIVLQFPSVTETNGSLAGQVLLPDGTPAGANVAVQISFGPDFVIRTDAEGRFATQAGTFTLPAGGYTVTATDAVTGGIGIVNTAVQAGRVNTTTVRLLGRGDGRVLVRRADGTPAAGASVDVQGNAFPLENFELIADGNGEVFVPNVFEGGYSIYAEQVIGLTRASGRSSLSVPLGGQATATVTLGGTATVRGTFLAMGGTIPVPFANIALGNIAFTATDSDGSFEFTDVPLGNFRLVGTDAVTGRIGTLNISLSSVNQLLQVSLLETPVGEVTGYVVDGYGSAYVPNAEVGLVHDDVFFARRTVTTGPDGSFRFPGTPAGGFRLEVYDPATKTSSSASGTLTEGVSQLALNVSLPPLADLRVKVLESDGFTPAAFATVRLGNNAADTDSHGVARFARLGLSSAPRGVVAESRVVNFTRRWGGGFVVINTRGREEQVTIVLRGVGSVEGTVFQSDGITPAAGAEVRMIIGSEPIQLVGGQQSKPSAGAADTVIADGSGRFAFDNIPAGGFRLTAISQALAATANLVLSTDGALLQQDLVLSASGRVVGRVLRADGLTAAADSDVLLTYPSLSGLPGRANARTAADGTFAVDSVPVGPVHLDIFNAAVGGIWFEDAQLLNNGDVLDLGDLILDEDFPEIVSVTPANQAQEVDINTTIELLFSEPLDPASLFDSGVFLRLLSGGPAIAASLELLPPEEGEAPRLLRITPDSPLLSQTTYQVVVVDGDLRNALGSITNRGPRDRVGRPVPALFSATFTTRDQRPPVVLSFTPANDTEQVDPRAVIRLSFDEPVRPDALITVTGPSGAIAGTTSLGVNGLVLSFVPTVDLPVNATITVSVDNVADLAGNFAEDLPLSASFATLDTIGPEIAQLRIKDGAVPVANAAVILEGVLSADEPGARIRFSTDFAPIGTTAAGVFEIPYTLPASGNPVIRAIAIDRFGNEGPVAELPIAILANTPPVVTFTRINPASGPVATGGAFSVRVDATDNGEVVDLRAAASGAASVPLRTSTGAAVFVQGSVSANAGPGSSVLIIASATDNSGASSGQQSLSIPVFDNTPPTVSISAPAANRDFTAGSTLEVTVSAADNFGVAHFEWSVSGAFTASGTTDITPQPGTMASVLSIPLPADVVNDGAPFTVAVRALDAAGIASAQSLRTYRMADRIPPRLLTVDPLDGVRDLPISPAAWTLTFSKAMASEASAGALADAFTVIDQGGLPIAIEVSQPTPESIKVSVTELPLQYETEYRLAVAADLRDTSANLWVNSDGSAVPEDGVTFGFRTLPAVRVEPMSGAPVVPGQLISVRLLIDEHFAVQTARFAFNDALPVEVEIPEQTLVFTHPLRLPVDATEAVLRVTVAVDAETDIVFPGIVLVVRPRDADDSGDGMLNGWKADFGLDPFVSDANADPDEDGLSNIEEFDARTDPLNPDTDGDGILDGVDPFPLLRNRAPVAGVASFSVNSGLPRTFTEAAVLTNASDPDGDAILLSGVFTQPENGEVSFDTETRAFTYTSSIGFSGSDSFTYTLADEWGLTASGTVEVTVNANRPPVIENTSDSYALRFGGGDGRVILPDRAIHGSTHVTLEMWFKADPGSAGGALFFYSDRPYPQQQSSYVPVIYIDTNGRLRGNFWTSSNQMISPDDVRDGKWHQVILIGAGSSQTLWLDGVQIGQTNAAVNHLAMIHNIIGIGFTNNWAGGNGNWFPFIGEVDLVRIWHRALNASEVPQAYTNPYTISESALHLSYKLGLQATPGQIEDLSGNGRTAVIAGGAGQVPEAVVSLNPATGNWPIIQGPAGRATAFVLPGYDPDDDPLTARILTLPSSGRLFQYADGGAGAEIVVVPAVVEDSLRRVVYVPADGFTGFDRIGYDLSDGLESSLPGFVLVRIRPFVEPSTSDLWDLSRGTAVTATSGIGAESSAGDAFGGNDASTETGSLLFADGQAGGFTHFIEWQTDGLVWVEQYNLFAADEPGGERGFSAMRLFGSSGEDQPFELLATETVANNPYFPDRDLQISKALASPFVGTRFRAEFDQWIGASTGPRVTELDGIGWRAQVVPDFSGGTMISLQNATATGSQGGFHVSGLIDNTSAAWAGDVGGTPALTAVVETTSDVTLNSGSGFKFELVQTFGGEHFVGRFRVSATTDPRSEFADGLASGGDVTANWTILSVGMAQGSGGEAMTLLEDGSVLVGGVMPATTTYTVVTAGISGAITGFRLELLEHPSLPTNGPGRAGNGNWVLNEFRAFTTTGGAYNRYPETGNLHFSAIAGVPLTISAAQLLAQASDPDGDVLKVEWAAFGDPTEGILDIASGSSVTYTAPVGFGDSDSFSYTISDAWGLNATGTITIEVDSNRPPVATLPPQGIGLEFDGSNDFVRVGNPAALQITGDQTLEFWIRPNNFTARRNPVAKAYAGEGTLTIETDGSINYFYGNLGANSGSSVVHYQTFNSRERLRLNQWNHVAIVRDLTAMRVRFYINGILTNQADALFASAATSSLDFLIGAGYVSPTAGILDEVRVWNVARSGEQILSAYGSRLIGDELGLVAYWNFDETSGNTVFDLGPHGLNAVMGDNNSALSPQRVASPAPFDQVVITDEDESVTITLEGTDPDNDPLTFLISTLPQFGRLFATADGTTMGEEIVIHESEAMALAGDAVIYLPNPNYHGIDSLSFLVSDGQRESAVATLLIRVVPVNDAPVGTDDAIIAQQGFPITTGNLMANDSDVEGDALSIDSHTQAANGVVVYNGAGSFTYTPEDGFTGEDSFTYTLSDGFALSAPVNVFVTVTPVGVVTWINPAGGNFATASNWFPATVPGASDHAAIALPGNYTVTLNTNISLTQLTLGGEDASPRLLHTAGTLTLGQNSQVHSAATYELANGTLSSSADFRIDGELLWTAGSMRGPGKTVIATGATAILSGTGNKGIEDRRILENHGEMTITATLFFNLSNRGPGARLRNEGSGILNLGAAANFQQNFGSPGSGVDNAGELRKTGNDFTQFGTSIAFNNSGNVTLETGSLRLNDGGSNTGSMTVAEGFTLLLGGGNFVASAESTLVVGGSLAVIAGAATFANPISNANALLINAGTLVLNSSADFATFTFNGGVLRGTGDLNILNQLTWASGDMADAGRTIIRAGGEVSLPGTGSPSLSANRLFINEGSVSHTGNLFFNIGNLGAGGRAVNRAGGHWHLQGSGLFRHNFGSPGSSFTNEGTLRKSAAGNFSYADSTIQFINSGRIEIEQGALQFQGGSILGGEIHLADANSILFLQSNTQFAAGIQITGDGYVLQTAFTMSSAEELVINRLVQTGGSLAGDFVITGHYDWTAGAIQGPGSVRIASGATASISSTNNPALNNGALLENSGTITIFNTLRFNLSGGGAGSQVVNLPGAVLQLQGAAGFAHNFVSTGSTITNQGILRKTGTGEAVFSSSSVALINSGTLDLAEGSMRLDGGAQLGGIVTLATDTTLRLNSSTTLIDGLLVSGAGLVVQQAGTLGHQSIEPEFPRLHFGGGTIVGRYTITNNFYWTAGALTSPGRLLIDSGATGSISAGSSKSLSNNFVLENAGDIVMSDTVFFNLSGQGGGGKFINHESGTFEVQGTASFPHNFGSPGSSFTNAGLFRKTGPGLSAFGSSSIPFINTGTLEIREGSLQFSAGFTQQGVVRGSGTIISSFTNDGTLQPDADSPAGLSLTGNLTQGPSGRIELRLAQPQPSLNYRLLNVSGAFVANGELELFLLPGFAADPDAIVPVIGFGSSSGIFTTLLGLADNSGYSFTTDTGPNAFNLHVVTAGNIEAGTTFIPEPQLSLFALADGGFELQVGGGSAASDVSQPQSTSLFSEFEYSIDLRNWLPIDGIVRESAPGIIRLQPPAGTRQLFIRARLP